MNLIQDRLDVTNKTRTNLFNWRGQFTPDFADYILESFGITNSAVIDPFSGSGTVLLECARRNLSGQGFEINPAAYAMSKFFTFANVPQETRQSLASSVEEAILGLTPRFHDLPLFLENESFRDSYKNFLEFSSELFSKTRGSQQKIIAINTLFIAEDYKRDTVCNAVMRAFNYIRQTLLDLPFTEKTISATLSDARLIHENCPTKANIIFTSPPYINVFNYHQNYRAILEVLGWNVLKVAQSEIGSNRKNRGNRFKTVVQYCLDMEQAIKSFWQCLCEDGLIILVVGKESNVRKTPFHNGKIVKDIAEASGGFINMDNCQRTFTNKFGVDIKEDIIILRKRDSLPSFSNARTISLEHMRSALPLSLGNVREDLLSAISELNTIEPSPIFTAKGVFLNAQ